MTPGGSGTVHIYIQTVHRTPQQAQTTHRTTQLTNWEECGPCPVFAIYTLAFALQLREKHGKTSVRVEKPQSGQKNLSQGRKNLVRIEKPQSAQKNLSQGRKTSVRIEKPQSGQKNLSQDRKTSIRVENLSQRRKTSVRIENLSQGRKISVSIEKPQSGQNYCQIQLYLSEFQISGLYKRKIQSQRTE